MALLLAMVLAWVGGARSELGNLGEATDHGLVGASAERAHADSIPSGKPIGEEFSESRSERESEDDPQLVTVCGGPAIEIRRSSDGSAHRPDAPSSIRAWSLLSSIGARGPPVG